MYDRRLFFMLISLFVQTVASETDTCVFISTHHAQTFVSDAERSLQERKKWECRSTGEEAQGGFASIPCQDSDGLFPWKTECLCSGVLARLKVTCANRHTNTCCISNSTCLNGYIVPAKSNCNTDPIKMTCACHEVRPGVQASYFGDRCEKMFVHRICASYLVPVNNTYPSCDQQKDPDSRCIHSVVDTTYLCEPALRDVTKLTFKECKRMMNATETARSQITPDVDCISSRHAYITVGVGVVVIVILILLVIYFRQKWRKLHRKRLDLLLKFEDMEHVPMDQDNIGNNGTEVESRAFLRSRSMPGP